MLFSIQQAFSHSIHYSLPQKKHHSELSHHSFTGEEVLDLLMNNDEELLNELCFNSSDDKYTNDEESIPDIISIY